MLRPRRERHVELDGDEHGPMMLELIDALCGADESRWSEAQATALGAPAARERLWDALVRGS